MTELVSDTNFGVVILCSDNNSGLLRNTTNSLRISFPQVVPVAAVTRNLPETDLREMQRYARAVRGGRTFTSLMDVGQTLDSEWLLMVISGSWVPYSVL